MIEAPSVSGPDAPTLRCHDLAASIDPYGRSFRLTAPALRPQDAVLRGRWRMVRLRSGLSLHSSDAMDVHDMTTEVVSDPGLSMVLFLHGRADVALGDRRYRMEAEAGPRLFALSVAEPDLFVRHGMRGNWVRKVSLSVPPGWLEEEAVAARASLARFRGTHGASASWTPSSRQIALAERIAGPSPFAPDLEALYLESHALEIVAETLAWLGSDGTAPDTGSAGRDHARVRLVCDYLDAHAEAHPGETPRLEAVARHAGMSVSALQRLFRMVLGTSVFDHYRGLRMDRARRLLERERITVTEAAFAAGYGNPANFATAFKRRYGLCPREARGARCAPAVKA